MKNLNSFYINGQWLENTSAETLAVINPATEQVIGQAACGDPNTVDLAVQAARTAFPAWSQTSSKKRQQYIHAIVDEMKNRQDQLAQAVSDAMGCPVHIAKWLHIEGAIYAMELFAAHTSVTEQISQGEQCLITKEAIGVCAFINPWNYPLHQFVGKVGAALAAGCTIVVKPSEQTPLQDYIMAEIFEHCGLPAGVFNLVPGTGAVVGDALSRHQDVDMVSFTGSTGAGIKVAQAAAPSVKRVMQELGGKSALIITEQADLVKAVTYGVEDVMLNSGQSCNTLARMLVPKALYNQAINIAKEAAEALQIGQDENAFLGPVSSKIQYQRVLDYIKLGIEEGASLVTGGVEKPAGCELGFYIKPTIFADVNNAMRIAQEEIFGPVLVVIPYENTEHAIEIANDSPYGLSAAVYAESDAAAIAIAKHIRAGQCFINGAEFNYHAPFGGYKQSGNGREFTALGVEEFLETKAMITTS